MDNTKHSMDMGGAPTYSTRVLTHDQARRLQSGMDLKIGGIPQHLESQEEAQDLAGSLATYVSQNLMFGGSSSFECTPQGLIGGLSFPLRLALEYLISANSAFSLVVSLARAVEEALLETYRDGGKRLCHLYNDENISLCGCDAGSRHHLGHTSHMFYSRPLGVRSYVTLVESLKTMMRDIYLDQSYGSSTLSIRCGALGVVITTACVHVEVEHDPFYASGGQSEAEALHILSLDVILWPIWFICLIIYCLLFRAA
ncbi:hypothetical protein H5410_046811 [Solanum commersonii]|uniref:Uncharacterized protein n=1 Tax=Solanum commersonii TaxID=4109 RepID=A0A9J5XD99_SOLCO|nr:hypothetical protein H5410_046811 [Solanum commersonii]